jgi:hypothetical protein
VENPPVVATPKGPSEESLSTPMLPAEPGTFEPVIEDSVLTAAMVSFSKDSGEGAGPAHVAETNATVSRVAFGGRG